MSFDNKKTFPYYRQPDAKDCGPTCLRIIAKHYKKVIPLQTIRQLSETTREGSSLLGLSEAAEIDFYKIIPEENSSLTEVRVP